MFLFLISSICFGYDYYSKWSRAPDIIVCESSNVDGSKFMLAISYWEDLGYRFNDISFKTNCETHREEYKIIVLPNDGRVQPHQHAVTNIKWENGNLKYATIYVASDSGSILKVLKHEIGHALGMKHTDDISDIMYAKSH